MSFKGIARRVQAPCFMALLLVAAVSAQADSALMRQARHSLSTGNANAAFEALQGAEAQHAGDIEFDYWLGLAANRAGKSGHAVFALERVLAQQPNHAAARLELAVAYARLGQGDAARRELDTLDSLNPPEAAQKQIAELRRQLGLGDRARRLEKRLGYVSLEIGQDDNPGSWPDITFLGIPLKGVDTTYGQLLLGGRQRVDLTSDQKLYLSLNGMARRHQDDAAEQFDQNYLGARAEWVKDHDGRHELSLSADLGLLQLDGENYYNSLGLEGEWRHQRTDRLRTLVTLGLRDMRFEADRNDYLGSRLRTGVRYQANRAWRLEGDLTLEYESDKHTRPGGDAVRAGIRGGASWQYRPGERLGADLSYTRVEYTDEMNDALAGVLTTFERSDDRLLAGLQWDKSFRQLWHLRARVQFRDQSSSHQTYTYDQTNASLALTRYF